LGVLESEKKAQSDRKMFLRLLVALGVAVLVLIATLCGAVYGIVDLTQKVDDNDGAMVSKATGDVMSTGVVLEARNATAIVTRDFGQTLQRVLETDKLVAFGEDGSVAVYHVSSARLSNKDATHFTVRFNTMDGKVLEIDAQGSIVEEGVEGLGGAGRNGTRRLLLSSDGRSSSSAVEVMSIGAKSQLLSLRAVQEAVGAVGTRAGSASPSSSTGESSSNAKFSLAPNGVTVVCPSAAVGDTGIVNGVTYTKRDRVLSWDRHGGHVLGTSRTKHPRGNRTHHCSKRLWRLPCSRRAGKFGMTPG
jgi:hypothetical protein